MGKCDGWPRELHSHMVIHQLRWPEFVSDGFKGEGFFGGQWMVLGTAYTVLLPQCSSASLASVCFE